MHLPLVPFPMCCTMASCHMSPPCPRTTEACCRVPSTWIPQLPWLSQETPSAAISRDRAPLCSQLLSIEHWLCCTFHRAVQIACLSCHSWYSACIDSTVCCYIHVCFSFKLHCCVKLPAEHRSWAAKESST